MGAGLNSSMARMRDSASSDFCPPLSSLRLSFHTPPNATFTSRPAGVCGRGQQVMLELQVSGNRCAAGRAPS